MKTKNKTMPKLSQKHKEIVQDLANAEIKKYRSEWLREFWGDYSGRIIFIVVEKLEWKWWRFWDENIRAEIKGIVNRIIRGSF